MTVTAPRRQPVPIAVRLGSAVALLLAMVVGILVLGRLADSDEQAMVLTTLFFGVVLVGGALAVRRRRELWVPLGATFAAVSMGAGALLGLPLLVDRTVDEQVPAADLPGVAERASGSFTAIAHPGEGTASVLERADGSSVLTLTAFRTDNGPDLRVYVVPPEAAPGSVEGSVDLGGLKGNVGDQQYDLPAGLAVGEGWRVVVWCRAFAVGFTEATLEATLSVQGG